MVLRKVSLRLGSIIIPALLLFTPSVHAAEQILNYQSNIIVQADSVILVTETIQVRAEGNQIKRGIYRDFPTDFRDRFGNRVKVSFDVLSVKRDDRTESYHTVQRSNGVRLYIGHKDRLLNPGVFTYEITYSTDRQLGFFEDHDELYWNVTGNGWDFPINNAAAAISLPPGIPKNKIELTGYTGLQGSKGKDFTAGFDPSGKPVFETTRQLQPREGLTIVAGWPKGFVAQPTRAQKASYLLGDNRGLLMGIIGLVILMIYYLVIWYRVGRDPEEGTIIPLFEPPHNLSPASMRYVREMGYDNETFSSAIVNLAVKGYLTINKGTKYYTLTKQETADEALLTKGERKVGNKLFKGRSTPLKLENKNHQRIKDAIDALKQSLSEDFHKVHFKTNRKYLGPGALISLVILFMAGFAGAETKGPLLFITLWLSIWTTAVISIWAARRYFMALIFTGAEVFAIIGFLRMGTGGFIALILVIVGVNALFHWLLKAPTRVGRQLLDKIEGFRMYLSTAEQHRLNLMNPPEKTPELFERYLPYALALDVDQEWAEQFSDVLARAVRDGNEYHPSWYRGSGWSHSHPGRFTSSLGSSLGSAISSSSTAPGSSSGFGGGGSSGGGGGGGGGGGW
jgi:uncharacterized membrane protein YgcG